jgi:uncharacterized protein (DUF433 family)
MDPREVPSYSFAETAHILRIPVGTLRYWLLGRDYSTQDGVVHSEPLIKIASSEPNLLSFFNVVEAHVLASLRKKHRLKMLKVRDALNYIQHRHPSNHPLADHWFETDGISVFISEYGRLVNASDHGQLEMQAIMSKFLGRIERDELNLAVRLYPYSKRKEDTELKPIVIDPRMSFGRPVIAGTGIPTSIIAERFEAGDSIKELARDYGRTEGEIEEALRWEITPQAA